MVNFGPLLAEIVSLVWGAPGNLNGFRVLATLLQRRHSTEVNQTLHYVWPSPVLVRYIYIFRISCPLTEFCHVQNSLCVYLCTIAQISRAISSQLECGPMPNVMVALPNIGGALCSTPQSLADATTRVLCSNAAKTRNPLKFARVPQTNETLVGRRSPYYEIL